MSILQAAKSLLLLEFIRGAELVIHNAAFDVEFLDAEFARLDPETRLVIVGDASMAPYELMATDGSIYAENVHIVIAERLFDHRRPLNSREPWPLYVRPAFDVLNDEPGADLDGDDLAVFDDDGALSAEFKALLP